MVAKNKEYIKVLVSMPRNFLEALDELADSASRSRSETIREAIREYIKGYTI